MQFKCIMYAVLFALVAAGCFLYALGLGKQAKALLIALAAATGVGVVVGIVVMILAMTLLDLRGEWSGIAVIAFTVAGGLGSAAFTFVVVFVILLAKLKPQRSAGPLRIPALILGGLCAAFSLNNIYTVTPRLHTISRLTAAATSDGVDFFAPAQKELVRRGERAVPAILKEATENPNTGNSFMLARTLGQIPGQASADALLAMLDNPNAQIRSEAAKQLGARGEKRALEKLLQQMTDPSYDNYQKAGIVHAIAQMEDASVVPRLLAITGPPPIESDGSTDDVFYESALIQSMGALRHPRAYEFLVGLHRHPRVAVRAEAIEQLANYPCRQTVLIMIEHLEDSEKGISGEMDALLLKVTALRPDAAGRPQARTSSETLRSAWEKWLDANGKSLPEQMSFE